ncbi:MAG: hypothetical protein MR001_06275 [Lachnoclostridium sp.]|nr:hypothetical protein [Lachnoclostridium sp.]
MNRAERRKAAQEQRNNNIGRNTNSKHNFVDMGKWDIPINELKQDENLKDPNADPEVMALFNEVYTKWMGSTLVKNLYSKVLITLGMEYLDTLTSLKFDLIPMEDRVYVRDTVHHMANTCNFFMGAYADGLNKSLQDYIDDSRKANRREVEFPSIINTGLEFETLPKAEQIDDMYADFLVKHANELDPYLILIKPSEIKGDEEYVCKVLRMIVNQSIKLDKEIEIPSRKYVVEL